MKIVKIASAAIVALLASSVVSCTKQEEKEQAPVQEVTFSVELNKADAEYAEVVVRHDGAESDKWFGFVTTDLTSDVNDLIAAQVSQVDKKKLHVGKAQTVAVRSLAEHVNYRYVAFGVNEDGTAYGKPGSLAFCSSPKFNVKFAAEASSVEAHKATFAVSHNGIEALTYLAFITDDTKSEAATLAAADFAKNVKDGKLVDGVTLLSGTAKTVSFEELTHETSYRLIVYGLFDNNGSVVYYGTPADVAFTTPVDLALVTFSVTATDVKKNSANINVSYNVKDENLTWFGFYTFDFDSDIAALVKSETAGVTSDSYHKGQETVLFEDLEPETKYRVIITGINADGVYGTPAEVIFTTLTAAYDNTVFTVKASDITPYSVKFTVTHNGWDVFEYAGFFTEDFESAVADVELPSNIDANLMTGKENTFTVEDLSPITKYRYIVVGRIQGNEYGTRGEVVFETKDDVVAASYEDFIGYWKVDGVIFHVTQKESGVSYNIEGLPGSGGVAGDNATVIGQFDSNKGTLYVMEQDLGQFTHSSYGLCGEFYSAGCLVTLNSGNQSQWPLYPFQSSEKRRIFNFCKCENGTFILRAADDEIESAVYNWQILEGTNKGSGNIRNPYITFPASVEVFEKVEASYSDFLGKWQFGDVVITITQKAAGSTYTVAGLSGLDDALGGVSVATGNYDAAAHEFYLMEQALGGSFDTADHTDMFGSNQYGMCDDYLSGMFHHSSGDYAAYPTNTDAAARIFTAFITGNGVAEIVAGSCSYGEFYGYDASWVIRSGEYAGKGNNYHKDGDEGIIPATMTKISGTAALPSSISRSWKFVPEVSQSTELKSFFKIAK